MKREAHLGDPCVFCDQKWDDVAPGECPGRPSLEESADLQTTVWALQDRYLRLHDSSLGVRKVLEAIIAELLAACKAADLYLDWGWGKLGPNAPSPEYPGKLLRSAIAKAESEIDA